LVTETFNSFSTGTLSSSGSLAIGSYTSTGVVIKNADAWGGAGGTGRYAYADAFKTLSVSITPSKYVGFWWSAGNANNDVNIYGTGGVLLGSFDAEVIPNLIGPKNSPNNVVAADGQTYSGSLYYGNPNGTFGQSASLNEPYAYVNLRLRDPTLDFIRIDFTGERFEFDNVSVSSSYFAPVPEIDPAGMGSVLALVTGTLALIERRRLKVT
jgi:hypothetical protein